MTVTRANIEKTLTLRRSPLMVIATMAVTFAGSNVDLNDPIGYAIRFLGGTVTDPMLVADADLTSLDDIFLDGILDVAELRLLRTIKGRLDQVDTRTGPLSESMSQLAKSVGEDIDDLMAMIKAKYGTGVGGILIETGYISLNFAEHNDALPFEEVVE